MKRIAFATSINKQHEQRWSRSATYSLCTTIMQVQSVYVVTWASCFLLKILLCHPETIQIRFSHDPHFNNVLHNIAHRSLDRRHWSVDITCPLHLSLTPSLRPACPNRVSSTSALPCGYMFRHTARIDSSFRIISTREFLESSSIERENWRVSILFTIKLALK